MFCLCLLPIAVIVLLLALFSFFCIALQVSNNDSVFSACGRRLWDMVLASFFMGAPQWLVIGAPQWQKSSILLGFAISLIMSYFLGTSALDALGNPDCKAALSNNTYGSPLLAIIALIFFSQDVLCLLIGVYNFGKQCIYPESKPPQTDG